MRKQTVGATYRESAIGCPTCGATRSMIVDTRHNVAGRVRRRRHCIHGHRFTTHEMVARRDNPDASGLGESWGTAVGEAIASMEAS